MSRRKTPKPTEPTVTVSDPEAVAVYVAPDAPRAVLVRGMYVGDFIFLINDVPVEIIELPDGFIDTPDEIAEARKVLDKLVALKSQVPEDQRDDLMFVIDDLASDVHYAEAVWSELEEEAKKSAEIAEFVATRPRDERGRFIAAR